MNEDVQPTIACPICHLPARWHGVKTEPGGGTVYRIDCPTPACTETKEA